MSSGKARKDGELVVWRAEGGICMGRFTDSAYGS